jgi:hypothetical protein
MKTQRHAAILRLIGTHRISSQEKLCRHLRVEGITVTQAPLSRDFHELRLLKTTAPDGAGHWLWEHHGARVHCHVPDVGQGSAELEGVDVYRQGDAAGFITLFGLPVRLDAQAAGRRDHRQMCEVA